MQPGTYGSSEAAKARGLRFSAPDVPPPGLTLYRAGNRQPPARMPESNFDVRALPLVDSSAYRHTSVELTVEVLKDSSTCNGG